MKRLGVAAIVLLALAGGLVSYRRAALERTSPGASGAPAHVADATRSAPGRASSGDGGAPERSPEPVARTSAEAADAGLVARLGLAPPGPSSVAASLARHDRDELALLADVERGTGRAAPRVIGELLEARRSGADEAELVRLAEERLAGDPLARAAVLRWLERQAPAARATGGDRPAAAAARSRPPAVAPLVPLQRVP